MLVFDGYFKALAHTGDRGYEAIGWTRLGDVVERKVDDSEGRKLWLIDFFNKNKKPPSQSSSSLEERRMARVLYSYCDVKQATYDPQIHSLAKKFQLGNRHGNVGQKIAEIQRYYEDKGCLPDRKHPLYNRMASYCNHKSDVYRVEFAEWARVKGYGSRHKTRKVASMEYENKIKEYCRANRSFPTKKPRHELYNRMMTYCSPSQGAYSPDFDKWARAHGYGTGNFIKCKDITCCAIVCGQCGSSKGKIVHIDGVGRNICSGCSVGYGSRNRKK